MNIQLFYRNWFRIVVAGLSSTIMGADCETNSLNLSQDDHADVQVGTKKVDIQSLNKVIPDDGYVTDVTASKPKSIQVRVLLDDVNNQSVNKTWHLRSASGFVLLNARNNEQKIPLEVQELDIECSDSTIHINGKLLTHDRVVIKSKEGNLLFDGKKYDGSFYVISSLSRSYLINCIDLEDYVYSVLGAEGWPGWSIEINKVLAIAIRTYCLSMMAEATDKKRVYHISNKMTHQVYSGVHNNKNVQQAVEQTAGLIMTFKNRPIIAMYHACCGGVIPAKISGVDFRKAPYLGRNKPCHYCKKCKMYDWSVEFSKDELSKLLTNSIPRMSKIKSVQISKKDRAGQVKEVEIKTAGVAYKLSSRTINQLPGVKSRYYGIHSTPKKIVFKGRGCGHRVGLCQWGAYGMVRDGWTYKKILSFYYPGITIKKIVV